MRQLLFLLLTMFNCFQVHAEDTHEIEPSILEIHYSASYDADMKKSPYMRGNNIYILRCGKKQSQYFCYENLRHDSLSSVPGGNKILYDEIMDWASHPDDFSKYPTKTPSYKEFLYRDLTNNDITIYRSSMGELFRIKDTPKMDWNVIADSVKTILGYECQMAETTFRGRHWKVWFTLDIPLSIGPWKFGGLPGLVLQAESSGFLKIEGYKILTKGLTPIKFYNYYNKKATDIDRKKFLKETSAPSRYPKGTFIIPKMELE